MEVFRMEMIPRILGKSVPGGLTSGCPGLEEQENRWPQDSAEKPPTAPTWMGHSGYEKKVARKQSITEKERGK